MRKSLWSLGDINNALGIELASLAENFRVVIDSREVTEGDIFIALRGERFDANCFIGQAMQSGAALCIADDVSKVVNASSEKIVFVDDAKIALIKLAKYRRGVLGGSITGITGSVGKSSSKQFLHLSLECYGKSYVSDGNFNSQIGLPLSIVNAPIGCDYYVFELGMSEPGEMRRISEILAPDIGVILNVKEVHQQSFASLDEIAKAKLEIIDGMPSKSTLILNKEIKQSLYQERVSQKDIDVRLFGDVKHCILERIEGVGRDKDAYIKLYGETFVQRFSKDFGDHLIFNMQAIFLCLKILRLDPTKAYDIFKGFKPIKGRGEVFYLSSNVILIDESYNSSPAALKSAIASALSYKENGRRLVAVIGDMLELGDKEDSFHENVNIDGVDKLFCVGRLTKSLFGNASNEQKGGCLTDVHELLPIFMTCIEKNDIILVKGSNGLKLNLLVEKIKSVYG